MPKDFRDRVTMDLLMERVVPPFRPPEIRAFNIVTAIVLFMGMFGLLGYACFQLESPVAGVLLIATALGVLVVGVAVHSFRTKRRAMYILLHGQAKDRAWRMLNGKASAKWGDSEQRLRQEAGLLLEWQQPLPTGSSVWVFVWWESE